MIVGKIPRCLEIPRRSFFLFGPRGTGKTTWLRESFPNSIWFNLLRTSELMALQQDPELFRRRVEARPRGSWIVVDEIQRHADLLNEVHDLTARHGEGAYRFALTGSSARKLRRHGVNLLAGRAVRRGFFPITGYELLDSGIQLEPEKLMRWGALPRVFSEEDDSGRIDFLESYVDTYVKEEIKEEALIRALEPFSRFLGVAAQLNGQILNLENVGREIGKGRTTVSGYYEILEDTLIGCRIPAYQPRIRIKEVAHPKFYLFDAGVTRALQHTHRGGLENPLERGALFETLVLAELRAWNDYRRLGLEIRYWAVPSGGEIDFVCVSGKEVVLAVEAKTGKRYLPEHATHLKEWVSAKKAKLGWVVLPETQPQKDGPVQVHSFRSFVERLWRLGV